MIYKIINLLSLLQSRIDRWTCNSILRFSYVHGPFYAGFHVEAAGKVRPEWLSEMIRRTKEKQARGDKKAAVKFVNCPGMHDYAIEGFIIRAHADIHIKANSIGTIVSVPTIAEQQLHVSKMDMEVVEGMAPFQAGVVREVHKIPVPFGIYAEPGHSMHLLPALMHFPHFDKVWIYPGTVDYDEFHVCNIIISVIAPCDFVIPAGTPMLQGFPFKRVNYHGISAAPTQSEVAQLRGGFPSRTKAFYRRMFHKKKTYTSEVVK